MVLVGIGLILVESELFSLILVLTPKIRFYTTELLNIRLQHQKNDPLFRNPGHCYLYFVILSFLFSCFLGTLLIQSHPLP